jgi:hypothetical protein
MLRTQYPVAGKRRQGTGGETSVFVLCSKILVSPTIPPPYSVREIPTSS